MKFRSAAATRLPRQLWRYLANVIALGGPLPFVQGQTNTLVLEVGHEHPFADGEPQAVGTYGQRVIRVFPCPRCSAAYLTLTFLHELAHAWIDAFHPEFSDDHREEEFAQVFSESAFASLPARKARRCWEYEMGLPPDARRSPGGE